MHCGYQQYGDENFHITGKYFDDRISVKRVKKFVKSQRVKLQGYKGHEISKEFFLETPLPKKRSKFFEGFLS